MFPSSSWCFVSSYWSTCWHSGLSSIRPQTAASLVSIPPLSPVQPGFPVRRGFPAQGWISCSALDCPLSVGFSAHRWIFCSAWKSGASAPRQGRNAVRALAPVLWIEAFLIFLREDFLRSDHRVAMDGHRVFHVLGVASGEGHHHRDIAGLRHSENEFVTPLQPFNG